MLTNLIFSKMKRAPMSNSKKYPEAWKVYNDCVRKWQIESESDFPNGWKYGIPNPQLPNEYLYSDCPGKLFMKFKDLFYQVNQIVKFKKFLYWLEEKEGKISNVEYEKHLEFLGEAF
jgi:hypothetical protein